MILKVTSRVLVFGLVSDAEMEAQISRREHGHQHRDDVKLRKLRIMILKACRMSEIENGNIHGELSAAFISLCFSLHK